jgi:uncharacterized RDD family membrane protein YckC
MTLITSQTTSAPPWRRLVAYGVDSGVIFLYLMLAVPALVYGAAWPWPGEPWRTQLLSLLAITLPVVLYFALSEASGRGATLGKRVLGLRVVDLQGERLPWGKSLLRSALKFTPWELAHTASYRIAASETVTAWQLGMVTLSLLLVALYVVSLFSRLQRTPYDRAAGSRVQFYREAYSNLRRA